MLYVHFKKIKMDSFEINKIFAAIIVTVLLVLGINKVSDVIFHVEKPDVEGYKVEIKVVSTSQTNEESQLDIFLHPELIDYINEHEKTFKTSFLWRNFLLLNIKPDKSLYKHEFKIYSPKKKQFIN